MKSISIEPRFLHVADHESTVKLLPHRKESTLQALRRLETLPFDTAYDVLRLAALQMVEAGDTAKAVKQFTDLAEATTPDDNSPRTRIDIYAALLQILTSLQIEANADDEALVTAAKLLSFLAQDAKRKDEPFMVILASLLYDISLIHNEKGQYKQAERQLEKSMKLFEKLAKTSPERYGAAHIKAQNASTRVYRSRVKQVNMLAHNQVATSTYLEMLNAGIEGATDQLIESLTAEGKTLAQMGRYREAVQYFSRALKYLTKIEPEFSERQLRLSIDLGEALLNVKVSRDKGIHLLNTMLHKATKLNAEAEHRRIVDILLNAKSRRLDILGMWHKVFPR